MEGKSSQFAVDSKVFFVGKALEKAAEQKIVTARLSFAVMFGAYEYEIPLLLALLHFGCWLHDGKSARRWSKRCLDAQPRAIADACGDQPDTES